MSTQNEELEFNDFMFNALDKGFECIADGHRPLAPFIITKNHQRALDVKQFLGDLQEGLLKAQSFVKNNSTALTMYAIVYDGYLTLQGEKWDGVFVEAGLKTSPFGFLLCQRYELKGLFKKSVFKVGNPCQINQPPSRI